MGATLRARERGGRVGEAQRRTDIAPLRQRHRQRAVERVAGRRRVHRVDLHAGHAVRPHAATRQRAGRAERDDHGAGAARDERVGRRLFTRGAAQARRLAGVGRQIVDEIQALDRCARNGRRVEDRRGTVPSRELERGGDALERDLAGGDDDLRPREVLPARVHVRHRERAIGAGRDADLVASRPVDEDQRGAGRRLRRTHDTRHADAFLRQRRAHFPPRCVVPHAADQPHLGTEPTRRHRLVGSLAAARDQKRALADRLAGLGQPLEREREIDVRRADH